MILLFIRTHLWALIAYSTCFLAVFSAWLFWLPKKANEAEQRFQVEVLNLLRQGQADRVSALAHEQRILRWAGRHYVLWESIALAQSDEGEHQEAIRSYREALKSVPPDLIHRVQLNLAHAHLVAKEWDDAEKMYRTVLSAQPDNLMAEEGILELSARRQSSESPTSGSVPSVS